MISPLYMLLTFPSLLYMLLTLESRTCSTSKVYRVRYTSDRYTFDLGASSSSRTHPHEAMSLIHERFILNS